jgi:hypothetical protein
MFTRFHLAHDVPVNIDPYCMLIIGEKLTWNEVTEFCQILGT